ncbi:hypothetical protein E9993_22415 [Labilibacter sediminis]|nr:hypothetical protein E9993_22415 [Labilibacter sediminis]
MENKSFCLVMQNSITKILLLTVFIGCCSNVTGQAQTGWIPTTTQTPSDAKQKVYLKGETTSGMLINFDIPGIYVHEVVRNDTIYQRISIPGQGTNTDLGKPELPVIGRIIEIPYDINVDVSVYKSEYVTLQDYTILPYQIPEIDPYQSDSLFVKDYKLYASNRFYPDELSLITSADIGIMRGHRVAFLKVNPLQYNPVSRELRLYSKVEVQVTYSKPAQVQQIDQRLVSEPFEKMLESLVLNYKNINRYNTHLYKDAKYPQLGYMQKKALNLNQGSLNTGGSTQALDVITEDDNYDEDETVKGCEYLIITTGTFYNDTDPNNAVLRFRNWKRRKGLITEVVLFEDIPDSDNSGDRDEEDLIDYIQTAYDTWYPAPTYVLLIGDAGDNAGNMIIPTNYRTQDPSHSNTLRGTDIYYSTLDGADYFPDIYIGRLSADSDIQATDIIDKMMDYEQDPPDAAINPNFYQNAAMLARFEDTLDDGTEDRPWIETVETIRTFLINEGYAVDRIYADQGAATDPARYNNGTNLPNDLLVANGFQWNGNANVISTAINNGRFMLLYRNHGDRESWTDPFFGNNNVDNLANGEQQPVVFSLACQTGWFDNESDEDTPVTIDNPGTTDTEECFSEHFQRNNSDGTVAIVASSRNSVTGYNDFMGLGFIKSIWNDFSPNPPYSAAYPAIPNITGNPLREMGQIMNFGKIYMANAYANSIFREEAFELYHLFGDPNMNIHVEVPEDLRVSFPEGVGEGYPQDFMVKVFDQDNNPVNNAIVSLCTTDGQLVDAAITNAGGESRLLRTFYGSELQLTVTADEFIPVMETIKVSPSGGYLNRLNPDNGTIGQPFNVGGINFTGSENVAIYMDNQLMKTEAASGGQLGQSGVQDISITVPADLSKGKYNVMFKGENSDKYGVDVFHVRDPNPVDLLLYSQWDPTTYYIYNGDNPTWNNPDIYLADTNNDVVGSNNLILGNQYNINARIRNKSNFTANNASVTFKWANFGSAQRTWTTIGTDQITVGPNNNLIAQVQWVPPITGHLCVKVEIYHNEDIYTSNNSGQENCNVGPTSSPLSVTFSVRNPSDVSRALHYEVRQLYPNKGKRVPPIWHTMIKHPDPQVLEPNAETEITVTADPDHTYVEPGVVTEFSVTNYLDGEIIGGVNLTTERGIRKFQLSMHGGIALPIGLMSDYYSSGWCLYGDAAYTVSPKLSLIGLFGLNSFKETNASSIDSDRTIFNFNIDAQYRQLVINPISVYVRGGAGYYSTANNWAKPGVNTGVGLLYHFNNAIALNLGADYHKIFKGLDFDLVPTNDIEKDLDFMQVTIGINYSF